MNEQLLPALEIAPPALARFAAELRVSHGTELGKLRQLSSRAGLADTNVHAGHQMPGLVSEADLLMLRTDSSGLLQKLREHLNQTALLARSEQDNGADDETTKLAASVEASRKTQLATLPSG